MSGTNYTHEQMLKDRIKELEQQNAELTMKLNMVQHCAKYVADLIDDKVETQGVVHKVDLFK